MIKDDSTTKQNIATLLDRVDNETQTNDLLFDFNSVCDLLEKVRKITEISFRFKGRRN